MKISVEELNALLATKDIKIAELQAVNNDLQQAVWALQQDLNLCIIQQTLEQENENSD